jgi:hypothetical protein
MAGFYWEDYNRKRCVTAADQPCAGPKCPAFCLLDEHYAYCGLTPRPDLEDIVCLPWHWAAGGMTFHMVPEMVVLEDAPHEL